MVKEKVYSDQECAQSRTRGSVVPGPKLKKTPWGKGGVQFNI